MQMLHAPEAPCLGASQGYQEYQKQRSKQEPLFKKMQKAFKSKDEEAEQEKLEQYKKTLQPTKLRTVGRQPAPYCTSPPAPYSDPAAHASIWGCADLKATGPYSPKILCTGG